MTSDNPAGLNGFALIEFADRSPEALTSLFNKLGFRRTGKLPEREVYCFHQGESYLLLNCDATLDAASFVEEHGPGVSALGFYVKDVESAYTGSLERGGEAASVDALNLKGVKGIGGGKIYFIHEGQTPFDLGFEPVEGDETAPTGLQIVDHLTHNVHRGGVARWADFYGDLFNFTEIRSFDIKGEYSGLFSRALTAPDFKIRIPLNEEAEGSEGGQIDEFLAQFNGEGVQHIAFTTNDIYSTIDQLRANGIPLMSAPSPTYYEMIEERLPGQQEPVDQLQERGLLVDGHINEQGELRLLLQIFTETMVGPAFFEIIQRKGEPGFGEGNFKALFESIERDQMKRNVLGEGE
jgi:4-hydroxyphenylpyruvate dioxygenase